FRLVPSYRAGLRVRSCSVGNPNKARSAALRFFRTIPKYCCGHGRARSNLPLGETLLALLDEPQCALRSDPAFELELLVLEFVGRDKEFLKVGPRLWRQGTHVVQLALAARGSRHGNDAWHLRINPGEVAASWMIMTSSGSPSSAMVEGMKPQSYG